MNQEIKSLWVSALRSGEYKQGVGTLYNESTDKYCCLGVLGKVTNEKIKDGEGVDDYTFLSKYKHKSYRGLVEMNDNGKTFNEIADYIEQNI